MNKADTIVVIRSLLTSDNSSLNIYKLNEEFKEETGMDIPLFGYKSLSEFLQSMPETVEVTGHYPNQQVKLIKSVKSAHIASLVKRQKKKSGKHKQSFQGYNYFPDKTFITSFENDKKCSDSICEPVQMSVEENLYQYLMNCPDGATFNKIRDAVQNLSNFEYPLKQYNMRNFIKTFPFCVFYEGRVYAISIFKTKFAEK